MTFESNAKNRHKLERCSSKAKTFAKNAFLLYTSLDALSARASEKVDFYPKPNLKSAFQRFGLEAEYCRTGSNTSVQKRGTLSVWCLEVSKMFQSGQ